MKKIIIFLTIAIALASCRGADGRDGINGEDAYGTNWHTQSFSVKSNAWQLKGQPGELNSFYYVDVDIPELSKLVFDEGTVIGYLSTAKDVKNGLPYVLHLGEAEGSKEFLWTQTYDFDFVPGGVRFYATFSDFMTQKKPGGETFHIVLIW